MESKGSLLFLDFTNKTGLAVARNLSKYGFRISVVLFSDVAARYSKYVDQVFYWGDPACNVAGFVDRLIILLNEKQFDALIPVTDGALEICRRYATLISEKIKILGMNDYDAYKFSFDKHELLNEGKSNGLIIPKGTLVRNPDDPKPDIIGGYSFPIMAKPVSSAIISNNILLTFTARKCNDQTELTDFIRENVNQVPVLIQEYLDGYGIGFNFISKDGEILNSYIHRRIHEHKGVSTLRESLPSSFYDIEDRVKKLVGHIHWNGVGMVEFRVTPDQLPVLMEFNGRFFGSTELSVKSGINLPVQFIDIFLLNHDIETGLKPKHVSVRFLHDEVLLNGAKLARLRVREFMSWLADLIVSLFGRNHFIEDCLTKDPMFVSAIYIYDCRKWYNALKRKVMSMFIRIRPLDRKSLTGLRRIMFFCHGNICRSPFAMEYARKVCHEFVFNSAGVVEKEKRMPPCFAVKAAENFGVGLEKHLSRSLCSVNEDDVDMYVVMDKRNYTSLRERNISSSKIRFLGNREITDPYGGDINDYTAIYREIMSEIDRVFKR